MSRDISPVTQKNSHRLLTLPPRILTDFIVTMDAVIQFRSKSSFAFAFVLECLYFFRFKLAKVRHVDTPASDIPQRKIKTRNHGPNSPIASVQWYKTNKLPRN